MAGSVQGSASSIGTAPATGGELLPSFTEQVTGGGGTTADAGAATGGAGTAATDPAATTPAAKPASAGMLGHLTWLGGASALGGVGLLGVGMSHKKVIETAGEGVAHLGNPKAKIFGGLAALTIGLGGIFLGSKAKAAANAANQESARMGGAAEKEAELTPQVEQLVNSANTQIESQQQEITTLTQQLEAARAASANPQPGQTDGGGVSGGEGQTVPGTTTPSSTTPTGTTPDATTPGADGTTGTTPTTPAGPWTAQSLVGTSITLSAGVAPTGSAIAAQGQFAIAEIAGDANGYATLDEANNVVRSAVTTETLGSRNMRWLVVEHEGRFYGAVARLVDPSQGATPPALTPQLGNIAAWSALNFVYEGTAANWQSYTWSQTGGAQSQVVQPGGAVFPGVNVGVGAGSGTPVGTPSGTVTGGGGTTTATAPAGTTAPAAATPFDPKSVIGRSFSINASTTAEGEIVRGGPLQIQRLTDISTGGFGTPEEAATAARAIRKEAGQSSQWSRWVSLKGSDNRYYVYEASIVNRATAGLENAAPMHVFAAGIAEYYDGTTSSWKAQRDAA